MYVNIPIPWILWGPDCNQMFVFPFKPPAWLAPFRPSCHPWLTTRTSSWKRHSYPPGRVTVDGRSVWINATWPGSPFVGGEFSGRCSWRMLWWMYKLKKNTLFFVGLLQGFVGRIRHRQGSAKMGTHFLTKTKQCKGVVMFEGFPL